MFKRFFSGSNKSSKGCAQFERSPSVASSVQDGDAGSSASHSLRESVIIDGHEVKLSHFPDIADKLGQISTIQENQKDKTPKGSGRNASYFIANMRAYLGLPRDKSATDIVSLFSIDIMTRTIPGDNSNVYVRSEREQAVWKEIEASVRPEALAKAGQDAINQLTAKHTKRRSRQEASSTTKSGWHC